MKVSGFSFIRNAELYDYPIVEAIRSILPLCDEVTVAVGNSKDDTLELVRSIHPTKIKIIETVWDDSLREKGAVLAQETDKALAHINPNADWAFYIQGDEVLHESGYDNIRKAMERWKSDEGVDGLLFNYKHFYGSYQYVADAYNWYRKEIRVIKPNRGIYSHGDAQGFRKRDDQKLIVKAVDAWIYHYGWVKPPAAQQRKQETFHKLWHDDQWVASNVIMANEFDYGQIDSLAEFEGIHPQVMLERIAGQNWKFDFDTSKSKMKLKYRLRKWVEQKLGISIGEYRNYKLL